MSTLPDPIFGRRWVRWTVFAALWIGIGMCDACYTYFSYDYRRNPITFGQAFGMEMMLWAGWGIMSILIAWLGRQFPFEHRAGWRNLVLHVLFSVGCAWIKIASDYPAIATFYCPEGWSLPFGAFLTMGFMSQFSKYLLIYWTILAVSLALDYYARYRERELQTARLRIMLADAQWQTLNLQLHPHFLFNTLNSISSLLYRDIDLADRMIARLGDLLRSALDNMGNQEVPLEQELAFLQAYLDIEKASIGNRLCVEWDVPVRLRNASVPYLILQPLVENALRHGVAQRTASGPGRIILRAREDEEVLVLQVLDNGPGLGTSSPTPSTRRHRSIGLANVRARLRQLYSEQQSLECSSLAPSGACYTLRIPLHRSLEGTEQGALQEYLAPAAEEPYQEPAISAGSEDCTKS